MDNIKEDNTAIMQHDHHSPEERKALDNRLARVIGHLEHVRRMIRNGNDCSEILIQLAATRAAINNTGKVILKSHIEHCISHAMLEGDTKSLEELNDAIDKFMK